MAKYRIIHCMYAEKFIEPFIGFLEKNFDSAEHFFLIKNFKNYEVSGRSNTKFLHEKISLIREVIIYFFYLNRAQRIIIHGLFNLRLVFALFLQPWLLKKCYWIMWGGDLYFYELRAKTFKSNLYEAIRIFVIKRLGYLLTYIRGDYLLAKKWYGAKGKLLECFMYKSNLFHDQTLVPKTSSSINILVGNSANKTNDHLEVFNRLLEYKNENIRIYCPLSYGGENNAIEIANVGRMLFGDRFVPLLDFLPFDKYLSLLGEIDIAIFAHQRQQGMGNTISLLGLGKKVFMRKDVVQWQLFDDIGVKVFDIEQLNIDLLSNEDREMNMSKIRNHFTESKLVEQYANIFEY